MLFLISLSPSLYWFLFSSSKCNQLSSSSSSCPRSFFPFLALLPPIPSSPLTGGWHTNDYCSRKTFDLNVFLSVSVKRHFTMGLLLFAHLLSRGMDCLCLGLSYQSCLYNKMMKVKDCISLRSKGQSCLPSILIKRVSPSETKMRQVYCSL